MINESIAFLAGVVIGFLTSIFVGPITISIMLRALSNKTAQAVAISIGSGFMDVVYCSAAMLGVASIVESESAQLILQISAIILFFIFGLSAVIFGIPKNKFQDKEDPNDNSPRIKRHFLLGVFLYFSNPGYIPYWLTVASIMQGYHILSRDFSVSISFAFGTGIGTVLWFIILIGLIEKFKMKISEKQFIM